MTNANPDQNISKYENRSHTDIYIFQLSFLNKPKYVLFNRNIDKLYSVFLYIL